MSENDINYPMVYLYEEGILGNLLSYGAYMSKIGYELNGICHEVMMLNEDFEVIHELDFGIEDYE